MIQLPDPKSKELSILKMQDGFVLADKSKMSRSPPIRTGLTRVGETTHLPPTVFLTGMFGFEELDVINQYANADLKLAAPLDEAPAPPPPPAGHARGTGTDTMPADGQFRHIPTYNVVREAQHCLVAIGSKNMEDTVNNESIIKMADKAIEEIKELRRVMMRKVHLNAFSQGGHAAIKLLLDESMFEQVKNHLCSVQINAPWLIRFDEVCRVQYLLKENKIPLIITVTAGDNQGGYAVDGYDDIVKVIHFQSPNSKEPRWHKDNVAVRKQLIQDLHVKLATEEPLNRVLLFKDAADVNFGHSDVSTQTTNLVNNILAKSDTGKKHLDKCASAGAGDPEQDGGKKSRKRTTKRTTIKGGKRKRRRTRRRR